MRCNLGKLNNKKLANRKIEHLTKFTVSMQRATFCKCFFSCRRNFSIFFLSLICSVKCLFNFCGFLSSLRNDDVRSFTNDLYRFIFQHIKLEFWCSVFSAHKFSINKYMYFEQVSNKKTNSNPILYRSVVLAVCYARVFISFFSVFCFIFLFVRSFVGWWWFRTYRMKSVME